MDKQKAPSGEVVVMIIDLQTVKICPSLKASVYTANPSQPMCTQFYYV